MPKAVSTVSFHVGGLIDAGVLKKVNGKYAVTTPEKVDDLVLQAIAEGPKTLDEVTSDKRLSMFPVERVHQSIDCHLLRRRLVSWPRVTTEAGSSQNQSNISRNLAAQAVLRVERHKALQRRLFERDAEGPPAGYH
jgi:hypothetical protein